MNPGERVGGLLLIVSTVVLGTGCMHVPASRRAVPRREAYLRSQRELSPRVADAIAAGHVLIGMDRAQVQAVLGDPVRRTVFDTKGAATEVWIYPAVRLHQGHTHAGGTLYRLVFVDGRLSVIEAL